MQYIFDKPIIASTGTEKYSCTILWSNGEFIVDEPEKVGGTGKGPDPYTLILSSLGACTLATLRMYVDRKGWDVPVIGVSLNMYHEVRDGKNVNVIDRSLNFISPLTDEQRERLIQIARLCPISKLLEAGVQINTFAGAKNDIT